MAAKFGCKNFQFPFQSSGMPARLGGGAGRYIIKLINNTSNYTMLQNREQGYCQRLAIIRNTEINEDSLSVQSWEDC